MGWYTYFNIDKAKAKKKFRKYATPFRIGMYTGDVGTDCFTLYMLYNSPPLGNPIYWQLSLLFILLPIIMTTIAVIIDVVTSPQHSICSKIILVPVIIACALFIPLYLIIMDAVDSYQTVPSGRNEDDSARARLNEALLESLPQAMLQTNIIVTMARWHSIDPVEYPGVQPWQWVSLTFSVISFTLTIATSTYILKAEASTRLAFFGCGLVAVTSRVMTGCLTLIPAIILLLASIIVWTVKRACHGCCACCCKCCTPGALLADSHRQCNTWSVIQVPITWVITAFMNCFTSTGLLMSALNLAMAIIPLLVDRQGSVKVIYSITCVVMSSITLIINVVMVAVPKCRRSIGEQWLNKDPETGHSQLY